jgi:ubiquitin-protein ligase
LTVQGAGKTPYEGGFWIVKCKLNNYPSNYPELRFVTPIYHPNVNSSGYVCLGDLKT